MGEEVATPGFWVGLFTWVTEFLKMVIPAGFGYYAALRTIKHQIKKHNDSKIEGYLNAAITEVYNIYVFALELFLSAYCMEKTGFRFICYRPLSTEILGNVLKGFIECLNKDLTNPFVRLGHIKETQTMILAKGEQDLYHWNQSDFSDDQWGKEAIKLMNLANHIVYYGAQLLRETPRTYKRKLPDEDAFRKEIQKLTKMSRGKVKDMVIEMKKPISKDELEKMLDEALMLMKSYEENKGVKFFNIENEI